MATVRPMTVMIPKDRRQLTPACATSHVRDSGVIGVLVASGLRVVVSEAGPSEAGSRSGLRGGWVAADPARADGILESMLMLRDCLWSANLPTHF